MWTIRSWYEQARAHAERNREWIRSMSDFKLASCTQYVPDMSREEIVDRLRRSNAERLAAVPDPARYPELRGMPELVDAEWRGTRDGAGLDDARWAAWCDQGFFIHRLVLSGRLARERKDRCTLVYFPESDHGPLLAANLDSSPDEPFGPPDWPLQNEHLIVGGVSLGVFLDEEPPEIFPAPVLRLVSRYCRTTGQAVEMLTRYNHFWGPKNLIVVDQDGDIAMIEKTACRIGVRRSPDGFGHITSMSALEPEIRAFLADRRSASLVDRGLPRDCADTAFWNDADRRNALLAELVDAARADPTLDAVEQIIRFRDDARGCVCYDGDEYWPGERKYTIRTTIWILRERRAIWWAREGDRSVLDNRKEDVVYSDVFSWG